MMADELSMNSERMCVIITEHLGMRKIGAKTVTSDKPWIFDYDLFTKRQSFKWTCALSPRSKKVRLFKSKIKVMLIIFFNFGIVHIKLLPQDQTINQKVYKGILQYLICSVQERRRQLWENYCHKTKLLTRKFTKAFCNI